MSDNKNRVYKLEPSLPEEIFWKTFVPPILTDEIEELTSVTTKNIKDIPHLGDLLFSFNSFQFFYLNFVRHHNQLIQFCKNKLKEQLSRREEIGGGRAEMILGAVTIPPPLLFFLDSLIISAKKNFRFFNEARISLAVQRRIQVSFD